MCKGVTDAVFPSAVLLVARQDTILFHKGYGGAGFRPAMIFDLASLTKPLVTSLAVMQLCRSGHLSPTATIDNKTKITIRQLLQHRSGLPAHRPYYRELCKIKPALRDRQLKKLLWKEPLEYPPGSKKLYSDLGFIILGLIVETICGQRLDLFIKNTVYTPLDLVNLFFTPILYKQQHLCFASTGFCPHRKIKLKGQVHDENAYAMGGVAGHAGLFGSAEAVVKLLQVLMQSFHGDAHMFDPEITRLFLKHALGFDRPSTPSSSGQYFSKNSVGHLGFTGTSFWMDLDQNIIIILLTNRVSFNIRNNKIKLFRPVLHDAVMETCLNT